MPMKFSTGYRNGAAAAALGTVPGAALMSGCVLMIYSGTKPASADDALGGATLLATYSKGGSSAPLTWSEPSGGSATKPSGDVWSATAVATGTPTFFRYQDPADAGALSTTAIRIQGDVGLVSDPYVDLGLSSLAIVNGAPLTIDAGSATVPSST